MRRLLALLLIGGVVSFASAQQVWNTVKQYDSGPSPNRLDIVVLGDGYTSGQMALFQSHVTSFINYLVNVAPYNRYRNHINVWRVEVESAQSGADHPGPCYTTPVFVNTALDATYCTGGTQRCITCNNSTAMATAMLNVPGYDEILVFVNDPEYGGCAGTLACVSASHPDRNEIAAHEIGHSIFSLADEYDVSGATYSGPEPAQINVSTLNQSAMQAAGTKWHYWLGIESIGCFEGAFYNQFGVYRPRLGCRMRNLGVDFCAVCREDHIGDLWSYAGAYDAVSPPSTGRRGYGSQLSAVLPTVRLGGLTPNWTIDGTPTPGIGTITVAGASTTYSLLPSVVLPPSSGAHTIKLKVVDPTTWWRKTPTLTPLPEIVWHVNDTFSDYTVTALTTDVPPLRAGELFRVTDTIAQNGTTPGPSVRVNYYLSQDAIITPADAFAGFRIVPALANGAASSASTWCRVPVGMIGTNFRVGAIVDVLNAAVETNEANNALAAPGSFPIVVANALGSSTPFASYVSGGTVTFNLNFGVGYASKNYYLLASVADPTNGYDLGALFGTAPFVPDLISAGILDGTLGAPVFNDFIGVLDATGKTAPSFEMPILGTGFPGTALHFFGFVLDVDGTTGALTMPIFSNRTSVLIF